jgi:hypothetical protein
MTTIEQEAELCVGELYRDEDGHESMPGGAPCCPGSGRSLSLWLQATHRASASSCLYLPVARYACRRRPAASGRILPAAWLGVLASVA